MTQISATIVADSLTPYGDRITTMLVTFPRFILAELNTHRMLSKNSASSRAIPFNTMVKSVQDNPFIPIAWQKEHSGMQGSEYLTGSLADACESDWLKARDNAVIAAKNITLNGGTKQLCNRLLEPFMWHTVLITATEFSNFFNLRCPHYTGKNKTWKSWKEVLNDAKKDENLSKEDYKKLENADTLFKLKHNIGQAEIHMMALAEAMYDARNESTPNQLNEGEWHIPFSDNIDITKYDDNPQSWMKVKVATAMCARTSYTVLGDEKEFTIKQQIALHDRLTTSGHWSPFEHCAKVMSVEEYNTFVKSDCNDDNYKLGWCYNYKGFIQYRYLLETNNSI